MKLWFILLFALGLVLPVAATHIVGGEFELTHQANATYRLTLNMYFDNLNGNPGAQDQTVLASIFEKGTNQRMMEVNLPLTSSTGVPYTSIACTNRSLSTNKLVYTNTFLLSPGIFTNPEGYYVVWERCCRNNVISNIFDPQNAGQAFYMEFPPVIKNNKSFFNSSPVLFPPVSDYACLNELFYYDFGGEDPDGDSLVYEMITPLNGSSTPFEPLPFPSSSGPYSTVRWTDGLGVNNQIPGNPGVSINPRTGRLTVRPTLQGLFVFGVRCNEYRDKVKIGETRRDFQLLVLNCPTNENPTVAARVQGEKKFYNEKDTLRITATSNRCLDIFLTDTDPDEALSISYKPVNFSMTDQIFSVTSGIVNRGGAKDSLKTTVCFPGCLDSQGKTYLLDVLVKDDGCSLPKTDTIRLTIIAEPVPNKPPTISTTAPNPVITTTIGEVLSFDVNAADPDNELISVKLVPRNFNAGNLKITFPETSGKGNVTSPFRWEIDCNATAQQNYFLDFVATTMVCNNPVTTTTTIEVRPGNLNGPPDIRTLLADQTIVIPFGGSVTDSILGTDPDLNTIFLEANGEDFALADFGMQFTPANGKGNARTTFSWTPDCRAIDKGLFKVNFTVQEQACNPNPAKVKSVVFKVEPQKPSSFKPANIFTPNGDGLNDYFQMPDLPPDFCQSIFASIKVFNRWGREVFNSTNREFKWNGQDVTDGVYYYLIKFSDKEYKGYVTLVH